MGHANLSNLSDFWNRRLYAKGKLSKKDAAEGAIKAKQYLRASEGEYKNVEGVALGFDDIVHFLLNYEEYQRGEDGVRRRVLNPVIEVVGPLTELQQKCWDTYLEEGCDGKTVGKHEDGTDMQDWEVVDTIQFRYAPGWRKKYPDIPTLGNVTH